MIKDELAVKKMLHLNIIGFFEVNLVKRKYLRVGRYILSEPPEKIFCQASPVEGFKMFTRQPLFYEFGKLRPNRGLAGLACSGIPE